MTHILFAEHLYSVFHYLIQNCPFYIARLNNAEFINECNNEILRNSLYLAED